MLDNSRPNAPSNLSRLLDQLNEEIQDSIRRGGIASSDSDVAREAAIGTIVSRMVLLGNALVDVAAFFGVTLTNSKDLQKGGYPFGFEEAHEAAQFIVKDVFRQGFPQQLWSPAMIDIMVKHIASRMASLQDESATLRAQIHELTVQKETLKAQLDGFISPAAPTQTPVALSQMVHATDPRAKPPEAPALPAPAKETKPTDFYVIERQSGMAFKYWTPKGKWARDPLDAMRFLSEAEAQRYLRTRVKPQEPRQPFSLRAYSTPSYSDVKDFYN